MSTASLAPIPLREGRSFLEILASQKVFLSSKIMPLVGADEGSKERVSRSVERILDIIASKHKECSDRGIEMPSDVMFDRRDEPVPTEDGDVLDRSFVLLEVKQRQPSIPSSHIWAGNEAIYIAPDSDIYDTHSSFESKKCLVIMLNRTGEGDVLIGKGANKKVKRGIMVHLSSRTSELSEPLEVQEVALRSQILTDKSKNINRIRKIYRELMAHQLFGKHLTGAGVITSFRKPSLKHPDCVKHITLQEMANVELGPDLCCFIDKHPEQIVESVRAFECAARALAIIHSQGKVYLDFKAAQVLCFGDKKWKLNDFESLLKPSEIAARSLPISFNLFSCSPEVALLCAYGRKESFWEGIVLPSYPSYEKESKCNLLLRHDVWSLGMCILQRFSPYFSEELSNEFILQFLRFTPEDSSLKKHKPDLLYRLILINQSNVDSFILRMTKDHAGKAYYNDLIAMLKDMLQVDPQKRMNMDDAVSALQKFKAKLAISLLMEKRGEA